MTPHYGYLVLEFWAILQRQGSRYTFSFARVVNMATGEQVRIMQDARGEVIRWLECKHGVNPQRVLRIEQRLAPKQFNEEKRFASDTGREELVNLVVNGWEKPIPKPALREETDHE